MRFLDDTPPKSDARQLAQLQEKAEAKRARRAARKPGAFSAYATREDRGRRSYAADMFALMRRLGLGPRWEPAPRRTRWKPPRGGMVTGDVDG